MSRRIPVFPLGTVLVPSALLPLHVFEQRYRLLMRHLLGTSAPGTVGGPGGSSGPMSAPEMGIVLIERGSEVGGGEERAMLGTLGRVVGAEELPDGRFLVVVAGSARFAVERWLPDNPYPLAEVEELPDEEWESHWDELLRKAEVEVRRAVALAGELGAGVSLPGLSSDPLLASWQLCAAVPVGPFDRQRLLGASNVGQRLALLIEQAREAATLFALQLDRN